jgi:hemoglobin
MDSSADQTVNWEALGGDAVIQALLDDFYSRIDTSPIRGMFPSDLTETKAKQFAFQSEFWGGPARYTPWRGFPRMRARHLPFPIGPGEVQAWLACMAAAVAVSGIPTELQAAFLHRLSLTAHAMANRGPTSLAK